MIAACEDRLRQSKVARDVPDDRDAKENGCGLEWKIERVTLPDATCVIVRIAWANRATCASDGAADRRVKRYAKRALQLCGPYHPPGT
jgi:hypothetical protein